MIDYRKNNIWTVYIHIAPKELTNKEHDMYYVGITSRLPEKRWASGKGYKKNAHFWNAIQKYGWDNMEHEIVAEHLTKEEACEFEKTLIKNLRSNKVQYGYNKTIGGEGKSYEYEDLSGQTFGYLYVNNLSKETGNGGERKWDCTCLLCGSHTTKFECVLKDKSTVSCGCFGQEYCKTCAVTHGMSYQKIYTKFLDIKRKCFNKNCERYKQFGEQGVTICQEWLDDFMNFYNWSMGNGYSDDKIIYLKKDSKEFSPDNCLWLTRSEYGRLSNRTNRKYITYNDETHTIKEWADIMGTTYTRLKDALRKKTFEEAFLFYTNKKEE